MSSPSVYARLNLVQAEMRRLKKTGYNPHHKFEFATADDVADAVRPLLKEHGIAVALLGVMPDHIVCEEVGKTRSGLTKFRWRLLVRYAIVNTDNPDDRFETVAIGEAIDSEDKGHSKALTSAQKYMMMKLFNVSTGEADPDAGFHVDHTQSATPPGGDGGSTEAAGGTDAAPSPEELYADDDYFKQSVAGLVAAVALPDGYMARVCENENVGKLRELSPAKRAELIKELEGMK